VAWDVGGRTRYLAHSEVALHLLRRIIRRFDDWLSGVEGVRSFTDDPRVILRIQDGRAAWNIPLPEGDIPKGSRALFIHLWNHRIPPMPPAGPDLGWARTTQRSMIYSFEAIARHVRTTPELVGIRAVGGLIAQINLKGADGGRLLFERLGFTIFPYHRPAGRFGEFWDNFYTWWLMWAFNPASVRHHPLLGLQRNEFWMTAAEFQYRFGK
jgi:hypothetical protein